MGQLCRFIRQSLTVTVKVLVSQARRTQNREKWTSQRETRKPFEWKISTLMTSNTTMIRLRWDLIDRKSLKIRPWYLRIWLWTAYPKERIPIFHYGKIWQRLTSKKGRFQIYYISPVPKKSQNVWCQVAEQLEKSIIKQKMVTWAYP